MDAPAPHFLLPLATEFLNLYIFSCSYNSSGWLLEIFFFYKGGATAQVCEFSLAHRLWSVFLRALYSLDSFLLLCLGACTRSQLQRWGWVSGFSTCGVGGACGPGSRSLSEILPDEFLNTVIRNHIPLVFLSASFLNFSLPPVMEVPVL